MVYARVLSGSRYFGGWAGRMSDVQAAALLRSQGVFSESFPCAANLSIDGGLIGKAFRYHRPGLCGQ